MKPAISYAAGPEALWALTFALAYWLVARNQPPTEAGSQQLERIAWFFPWVTVLLTFVPLAWAPGSPWWWLLRIAVTGLVGVVFVTGVVCNGIDYGDSRNSGVGSGYMLLLTFGFVALIAGVGIAALFIATKWRFLPVLKWAVIVLLTLAALWGLLCWVASFGKRPPA
ncbi:MAG: hypothetical protein ABIZ49_12845 [Opitutaceae bacterium]